jgi:hypothetical protein
VGAVRRYSSAQGRTLNQNSYLGATRSLHDAVRSNGQEMVVCCVENDNVPLNLAERLQLMFAKQHIQQVRQLQISNSRLCAGFFHVSWLKNTLKFKAFEEEERSTVPPHNVCRCTKRTAGGASSSVTGSAISLFKQKCSVSEGISTS